VPEALDVNTRMYQNLYRNSHLFGRMINFSSGAAYGTYRNIINAKESDLSEFIPTNPYGYSKYLNSQFTYTTDNIVDLYLVGVFGKYEIESRFIPSIVRAALEGNNPTVYKDRKMSYIWVNDLMPIIDYFVNCATSKLGQAYNITNQVINLVALAHLALNCIHRSKDSLYILSSEKAHEYTGCGDLIKLVNPFVEFTPLEEALRYYIEKEFT
jgi:GDP-L-fucose synthase